MTAGNAAGLNDGATGCLIAAEDVARELELPARMRLVGYSFAGVEPEVMGVGPIPATEQVLRQTGLSIDDIGLIEINEAFAVQVLAFLDHFGIADDDPRVNPWGGAIAVGHPLASSGVRLMTQLARHFEEHPEVRYGLTTMCVGLGMGGSVIWENPFARGKGTCGVPGRGGHLDARTLCRPPLQAGRGAADARQRSRPHAAEHPRAGRAAALVLRSTHRRRRCRRRHHGEALCLRSWRRPVGGSAHHQSRRGASGWSHRARCVASPRRAGMPTFAYINGAAMGGGLEVALHCRYRTISTSVRAVSVAGGLPRTRPGWGGTQLLPNLVGPDRAVTVIVENALANNTQLTGPQAYELGLADAMFEPADFLAQSLLWTARVLRGDVDVDRPTIDRGAEWDTAIARGPRSSPTRRSRGGARAVPRARAARSRPHQGRDEGFAAEDDVLADLILGDELRSGLYAFDLVQKRANRPAGAPDKALAKTSPRSASSERASWPRSWGCCSCVVSTYRSC